MFVCECYEREMLKFEAEKFYRESHNRTSNPQQKSSLEKFYWGCSIQLVTECFLNLEVESLLLDDSLALDCLH